MSFICYVKLSKRRGDAKEETNPLDPSSRMPLIVINDDATAATYDRPPRLPRGGCSLADRPTAPVLSVRCRLRSDSAASYADESTTDRRTSSATTSSTVDTSLPLTPYHPAATLRPPGGDGVVSEESDEEEGVVVAGRFVTWTPLSPAAGAYRCLLREHLGGRTRCGSENVELLDSDT